MPRPKKEKIQVEPPKTSPESVQKKQLAKDLSKLAALFDAEIEKLDDEIDEEEEEKDETKLVDLREAKYKAFVIPAEIEKHPDWPFCKIGTSDEAFPFRALPLTEKPSCAEIQRHVGGSFESVVPNDLLTKAKYRFIYVNDEGLLKGMEFNCDASAFSKFGLQMPLVGNAVISK